MHAARTRYCEWCGGNDGHVHEVALHGRAYDEVAFRKVFNQVEVLRVIPADCYSEWRSGNQTCRKNANARESSEVDGKTSDAKTITLKALR